MPHRIWLPRVRALTAQELAEGQPCWIGGCEEPATHHTRFFYAPRMSPSTPWCQSRWVCVTEAERFARKHNIRIEAVL